MGSMSIWNGDFLKAESKNLAKKHLKGTRIDEAGKTERILSAEGQSRNNKNEEDSVQMGFE